MRVAVDPSNPPFEYRGDDGVLAGFDLSLMEMVAEQAGLEFEWVELDCGDFQTAPEDNTADVSVAGAFPPILLSDQPIVGQEVLDQLPESIEPCDAFFVMDERG